MARLLVFMVVMPILWIGIHYYLDRQLVRRSAWPRPAKSALRAVILVAALLPVSIMATGRLWPGLFAREVQFVGFFLIGLSSVAAVMLVTFDLVLGGAHLVRRWQLRRRVDLPPTDPTRRGFFGQLANLGVVGTAGSVGVLGFFEVQRTPSVVECEVPIAGLPPELHGFRIVQLTDIHVGPTIRAEYLERCVEVVNGLGADVVAVTGDLIDGFVGDLGPEIAALGRLQATSGAYFVTGNHEYYWDGPAWCAEVERLGLRVLNNRHEVIERGAARLLLAGVTDISAGGMVPEHASDPAAARRGAPPCHVSVLLAHQPRSVYAAADAGYDLQISGHTHGGQYFPMNVLVHLAQPYVAGLARHGERMWIYVSRGTGYWGPPMRVGAPAEITLLRLVPA